MLRSRLLIRSICLVRGRIVLCLVALLGAWSLRFVSGRFAWCRRCLLVCEKKEGLRFVEQGCSVAWFRREKTNMKHWNGSLMRYLFCKKNSLLSGSFATSSESELPIRGG
jgi:hypothetical protein